MKFGIFDNFGAKNSAPVFSAFRQGLNTLGLAYADHDHDANVAVIWSMLWKGRMTGNQHVWKHFHKHRRPVLVLEVGMLDRGRTWKLGIGGTGWSNYLMEELDPARPGHLNLVLKPWSFTGDDIVIALQRTDSQQWANQQLNWLPTVIEQLKQHTNRNIVVRPHPRQAIDIPKGCVMQKPKKIANTYDNFDFEAALSRTWAVINWSSAPGILAVLNGIPAFVGGESLAAPLGNLDITGIENPNRPDRTDWLVKLSHTEWTLDEIASGFPLARLLPTLESF